MSWRCGMCHRSVLVPIPSCIAEYCAWSLKAPHVLQFTAPSCAFLLVSTLWLMPSEPTLSCGRPFACHEHGYALHSCMGVAMVVSLPKQET